MYDLSKFTTDTFIPAVDAFLDSPTELLSISAAYTFGMLRDDQIKHTFAQSKSLPQAQSLLDKLGAIGGAIMGSPLAMAGVAAKMAVSAQHRNFKVLQLQRLVTHVTIERPVNQLSQKEKLLLKASARLALRNTQDSSIWTNHYAVIAYNQGEGRLQPTGPLQGRKDIESVFDFVKELLSHLPSPDAYHADLGRTIAALMRTDASAHSEFSSLVTTGARWATEDDIPAEDIYGTTPNRNSITIGYFERSKQPVYYNGAESLVTIGGPGSGKSSGIVIPNLVNYPGSAVVLDPKGELWDETARWRERHFGPVFRFAPTDPNGSTHRFNPFDFISQAPQDAALQCEEVVRQLMPRNDGLKEPYWENRARDLVWALSTVTAMRRGKADRTFENVAKLASVPLLDEDDSDINKIIRALKLAGTKHNINNLNSIASSVEGALGEGQRLETIMDVARSYLGIFTKDPKVAAATSTSDWHPNQLRTKPGTTIYLTFYFNELQALAPIVRIILFQHLNVLLRQLIDPKKDPVITFFLDEMPTLGRFDVINTLQNVGRGSGLRLWMFAQYLGQLSDTFGSQLAGGMVGSARSRMYLQPDDETARELSRALGETRNIFTGENEPLVRPEALTGRGFADKTIITTRSGTPMLLVQKPTYKFEPHKMGNPPAVKPARKGP